MKNCKIFKALEKTCQKDKLKWTSQGQKKLSKLCVSHIKICICFPAVRYTRKKCEVGFLHLIFEKKLSSMHNVHIFTFLPYGRDYAEIPTFFVSLMCTLDALQVWD